jgi:hypothetical protein
MANPDHLKMLRQDVDAWNAWREREPSITPDLSGANLRRANLSGADLMWSDLFRPDGGEADLSVVNLRPTNLSEADLSGAYLAGAVLIGANLSKALLIDAYLSGAVLNGAHLSEAVFNGAHLSRADLSGADLKRAHLFRADLSEADLSGADLSEANLSWANLVNADLTDANLTGCRIYGVSAWGLKLNDETSQRNLIITTLDEPEITVDNIEVAQFIYLLLRNQKIRDVIDTISRKGVLLLGRFTNGRIAVLERLREELRARNFLPMVFNFDKPETKNFTETVRLLAAMSRFVIADLTNPRSAPLELQATVPECMIPFVPILEKGEEPFAMLRDLQINHPDRVFKVIRYPSVDRLVEVLDSKIIRPAQARFARLVKRKAAEIGVVDV